MQAALTTTLASETAAALRTEASETITTVHRTMAGSEMETAVLTVVLAAATAAPATTVGSETAAVVSETAASEAEEVISSGATAAA